MCHHRKLGEELANAIFARNPEASLDDNKQQLQNCLLKQVTILSCESNIKDVGVSIRGLEGREYTIVSVFHAIQSVFLKLKIDNNTSFLYGQDGDKFSMIISGHSCQKQVVYEMTGDVEKLRQFNA